MFSWHDMTELNVEYIKYTCEFFVSEYISFWYALARQFSCLHCSIHTGPAAWPAVWTTFLGPSAKLSSFAAASTASQLGIEFEFVPPAQPPLGNFEEDFQPFQCEQEVEVILSSVFFGFLSSKYQESRNQESCSWFYKFQNQVFDGVRVTFIQGFCGAVEKCSLRDDH